MNTETTTLKPVLWSEGKVLLIDQTRLPLETVWLEMGDYRDVIRAIKEMRIRGAPAIGVAGAYAVALAAQVSEATDLAEFLVGLAGRASEIREARPTGANLAWAVERMVQAARRGTSVREIQKALVAKALTIQREDEEANHRMGQYGARLVPHGSAVLTHCNTGALATGGFGTALGVIRAAWDQGKVTRVFATETRPFLQGARLTAWELVREGIPVTLIADSAAGHLMARGEIGCIIVGADRVAANGDVANKIGTYTLAVLAREHGIRFYVAAPTSTIDLDRPSGDSIPLEERSSEEVTHLAGVQIAPQGVNVLNPAFDVTPHQYVDAIITEKRVVLEPYEVQLTSVIEGPA